MTGVVQHKSGLYIPAETLDKHQHTLTRDEFQKFRRAIKTAMEHGMRARFLCVDCEQPIQLLRHDRLIAEVGNKPAKGGRETLECACATWTIR